MEKILIIKLLLGLGIVFVGLTIRQVRIALDRGKA